MSLPPITIPLLDPASPIDPDNDLLLIRQGLNDRKATVGNVSQTRLGTLSILPGQVISSDVLLVGRNNGSGYDNYILPPQYLGFLNGTSTWFWQSTAPLGWTIVPNSGDKVLATVLPGGDAAYQYTNTGYMGTWEQRNHQLTLTEIPPHYHDVKVYESTNDRHLGTYISSTTHGGSYNTSYTQNVGGNGAGEAKGHNHGFKWRPAAAVGILCVKDKLIGE